MSDIKVILVDDHKIFREGLKMLLGTINNVEVIGEASNGVQFLSMLDNGLPDIVFMDINMKEMDGLEASEQALKKFPDLKIIALTSFDDEEYFNRMTDLGVKGYLLKNTGKDDFEKAISKVKDGYNFYSDEIITKLTQKMAYLEKIRNSPKEKDILFTDEELKLLQLICEGLTNKQIADQMHLSSRTIEAHRAKLLDKTGTKNSVALAVFAISKKLIDYDAIK